MDGHPPVPHAGGSSPQEPKAERAIGRVVAVGNVTHMSKDGEPTVAEVRFCRHMTVEDQPYQRRMTVPGTWQKMETGWLTAASFIVISNKEGTGHQTIQSPTEIEDTAKRVIEVGLVDESGNIVCPFAEVKPGEQIMLCPVNLDRYRIKTRYKAAKAVITTFPV